MADKNVEVISDSEFAEKVLNSDQPVLVDFFANWCGPCKMIAPILEELATEFSGKVKIAKLDVDQNQNTAAQYGVRSIPTMILFENGEQKEMLVGADPARLRDLLTKAA